MLLFNMTDKVFVEYDIMLQYIDAVSHNHEIS